MSLRRSVALGCVASHGVISGRRRQGCGFIAHGPEYVGRGQRREDARIAINSNHMRPGSSQKRDPVREAGVVVQSPLPAWFTTRTRREGGNCAGLLGREVARQMEPEQYRLYPDSGSTLPCIQFAHTCRIRNRSGCSLDRRGGNSAPLSGRAR